MEEKSEAAFEERFLGLVNESRGLLQLLQSVKGRLSQKARDDQLYRMTLKRFRDDCIRLASFAESYALLAGERRRDALLSKCGCTWDDAKSRVDLG